MPPAVYAVSGGVSKFAKARPDKTFQAIVKEAYDYAIRDIGLSFEQFTELVDGSVASYFSDHFQRQLMSGIMVQDYLGLCPKPGHRVEGGGATGGLCFQEAWKSVASGHMDICVAYGFETMTGGVTTIGAAGSVGISETRPSGGPPATSWTGSARELVSTAASWQLQVEAICGEVSGYEVLSFASPLGTERDQSASQARGEHRSVISGGARILGTGLRQGVIIGRRESSFVIDPAVWRAIAATGYHGHIAHEFIPRGEARAALRQTFVDCAACL